LAVSESSNRLRRLDHPLAHRPRSALILREPGRQLPCRVSGVVRKLSSIRSAWALLARANGPRIRTAAQVETFPWRTAVNTVREGRDAVAGGD
jgi:hypothetical protein